MGLKKYLFALLAASIMLTACSDSDEQLAQAPQREEVGLPPTPETPPAARLPESVKPTHYTLHLQIDPGKERFSGSASIDVELATATPYLWLHGVDIEVSSATALLAGGENVELNWEQVTATGVVKLSAATALPAGITSLQFEYTAPFNTSLEGLYKVTQGSDSYAFTQFEATSARLAFPSFDEPAYKVSFDISMTIPQEYTGITNSPQISEAPVSGGMKTLTFAPTKPLPTYLIAFAVGPFDVVEWESVPANDLRSQPLPLRGITTRGKGSEIHYALENTAAIVEGLEDYFDTPYPYAKLDIIAVPDFSAGAMENAGAITYREQLILLDENAPANQKRGFFITHAHELAHQWFGNLVTPLWWDDIWLNESFATWNSHIVLDNLFPEEKYREALQSIASGVMRNDSLASARQIREPIVRHEDIGSAFNGITYRKGGGVLSMFESFLGKDNFRKGIRQYMKTFAFGNTTAEDFIGAIAEANPQVDGEDLRAAFNSYIEQPGLPLVSAKLRCDQDGPRVELSQQRYLPTGSEGSTDQTWIIPTCISSIEGETSSSQCFLFKNKTQSIALNSERCPDAILPNTGGNSYYRWSLSPEQWQPLLQSFDQLSGNEQISVANSLSAAVNNGSITLSDYLAAVPTITASHSWRVAMAPRTDLYKIKEFVLDQEERLTLQARLAQWYRPQLDRLNAITNREADEDQFRALAMSTLALGAQDPAARAELAAAGAAYVGFEGDGEIHRDAVDPNFRLIALIVAVEEYGKPYADLLWSHFQAADNAQLRQDLLRAMAESTDSEVAETMRTRILSPELRDNEIFNIYYGQMSHEETRQATWSWSVNNMEAVIARIPTWRKGQIPAQFDEFCSRSEADEVERFFSPVIDSLESGPRYLANTLETIRLCAAFADLHSSRE